MTYYVDIYLTIEVETEDEAAKLVIAVEDCASALGIWSGTSELSQELPT